MRSATVLALLVTTLLAACGATIAPGSAGLKYKALRKQAFSSSIYGPGYYPLWAWNRMIVYDITTQSQTTTIHVLTKDNLHVPATVTVSYHPLRDRLYELHSEIGPQYYEEFIGPAFVTLVRGEFAQHLHNDLASESAIIEQQVKAKLQAMVEKRYLVIDQVAINHIDYDATITQAISAKISTKQQAEQKKFEIEVATREAEIARTVAQGRSDAIRIQAEGEAAAMVLRGKAQAEAQEQVNRTLTPRYLQYKAFDQKNATYFFVPTGKDGMPVMINTGSGPGGHGGAAGGQ
jgi:regulator of protease activity HflC (stomatin/prohibitin superfamily)